MNTDRSTFNLVIVFLGLTLLLCVVGGFFLAYRGVAIPEFIVGMGGLAGGAIAGILAKSPTSETQSVQVENDRPIPVEEVNP